MRHTIQALVENRFGVLSRVASLFSARGYNIESLAVGETQDSTVSCMTIVVDAEDERVLEQIKKQLHKLIDVITVIDFTRQEYIDRDLILIKILNNNLNKKVIEKLVKKFPVKIIGATKEDFLLEICPDRHQEDEILKELKSLGIKELVRTGRIAIGK
ncbi:MAG: acetolactate synthase small subunit [Candidatus Omnitrophica bacterium]|nr:acetolactate synthase small subunit [Candidatus Omnitrophota bacterium]